MARSLLLPGAVFLVLGSMLVPLPPMLLDGLLVANLLLSVVLLVAALYTPDPLRLAALPSILLLATLYRLALNISTTRLILGAGEPGRVVQAFGSVVVQGNLVVGVVVFVVVTLVQFLVIAKGSERIAEVAARFTLDALPGKQMSIDADVRGGLIDFETARSKRENLQLESRFYGALDGAMKFIKGDAIAGCLITLINVVGGFITGIAIQELSVALAIQQYTLLTIGDGLVSQIPALLNSLAAGIIVTRVQGEEGSCLAEELPKQLLTSPRTRFAFAGGALLLALVPGMPIWLLIPVGVVALVSASTVSPEDTNSTDSEERGFEPRLPQLIALKIPRELWTRLSAETMRAVLESVQKRVHSETGLVLPQFGIELGDQTPDRIELMIRGLKRAELKFDQMDDTLGQQVLEQLVEQIGVLAVELLDDLQTRRILAALERESPEVVAAAIPEVVSVTQLTRLLRALLEERVSLRNLDLIFQNVAEFGRSAGSEEELLGRVRVALRHSIWIGLKGSSPDLKVVPIDPFVSLAFGKAEREGGLPPLELVTALIERLGELPISDRVLVGHMAGRRLLWQTLISHGLTRFTVLAEEELSGLEGIERCESLTIQGANHESELLEQLAA